MDDDWKGDILEYAQEQMNNNDEVTHKKLVSHLCKEVAWLRTEIERLEKLLNPTSTFKPKWSAIKVLVDDKGEVTHG